MVRTAALTVSAIVSVAGLSYVGASIPSAHAAEPASADSASSTAVRLMGEVVSVDPQSARFVVRESTRVRSTKELSIQWDGATRFVLGKSAASASELAAGDTVKLAYSKTGDGKNLATSVSIIKAQKN